MALSINTTSKNASPATTAVVAAINAAVQGIWGVVHSVGFVLVVVGTWILSFVAVRWVFPSAWNDFVAFTGTSLTPAALGIIFAIFRLGCVARK